MCATVAYSAPARTGLLEVPTGSIWYSAQTAPYAKPSRTKPRPRRSSEAGLSGGLTVEYLGLPQYPELLKTGEVVQEQLKKIGIDMAIQQVDVSVWFDHFSKGTYQITSAYQERTIDPDNFYSLVLKSGRRSTPRATRTLRSTSSSTRRRRPTTWRPAGPVPSDPYDSHERGSNSSLFTMKRYTI